MATTINQRKSPQWRMNCSRRGLSPAILIRPKGLPAGGVQDKKEWLRRDLAAVFRGMGARNE
jgi:hypothetical protein